MDSGETVMIMFMISRVKITKPVYKTKWCFDSKFGSRPELPYWRNSGRLITWEKMLTRNVKLT